jgi:hypothetical protein
VFSPTKEIYVSQSDAEQFSYERSSQAQSFPVPPKLMIAAGYVDIHRPALQVC